MRKLLLTSYLIFFSILYSLAQTINANEIYTNTFGFGINSGRSHLFRWYYTPTFGDYIEINNQDAIGTDGESRKDFILRMSGGKGFQFIPREVEAMRITPQGRVGIGTDSPNDKLEIKAPNRQLRLTDSDDNKFWQFSASSNVLALRFQEATPEEKLALWANSQGNIGIGTNNPVGDGLTIVGGEVGKDFLTLDRPGIGKFRFNAGGTNTRFTISASDVDRFSIGYDHIRGGLALTTDTEFENHNHILFLKNDGNVGIGTAVPSSNLEVKSSMPSPSTYEIQKWTNTHHSGYDLSLKTIWDVDGINHSFIQKFNGTEYNSLSFFAGKIGIGTTKPKNKLSVNGTIWAKKIKVTMEDAADWVFEEDYELRSLEEVEAHITKYKHLPDMPSAEEFKQNDMDIAEMNNKLLQKIEELTLYLIKQDKNIKAQQRSIEQLQDENTSLIQMLER